MAEATRNITLGQVHDAFNVLCSILGNKYSGNISLRIARLFEAIEPHNFRRAEAIEVNYKKYRDPKYYNKMVRYEPGYYTPTSPHIKPEARRAFNAGETNIINTTIQISTALLLDMSLIEAIKLPSRDVQLLGAFIK
jgi:hypothetical protein